MDAHAARTIAAPPEAVFAFLADPDRHWQLLGRRLEPLRAYDGERSRVRLRGPLGVRRTLSISLSATRPPHELVGRVESAGAATVGTVRWAIRAARGTAAASASIVELTARADVAGPLDRMLLTLGGTRWLRRSLEVALAALGGHVERGRGEHADRHVGVRHRTRQ